MTQLANLFKTLDDLSDEEREQVLSYLQHQNRAPSQKTLPARIFDMHPQSMQMSDDFNAELPDSFWFGDE